MQTPEREGSSHVPAMTARADRLGPVERDRRLALTLVLSPRDATGLFQLAQRPPRRTQEVDARHRPDAARVRRVLAACEAAGLAARVAIDGYLVEVEGTPAQVERAFGVRLDTYRVAGVRGHAPRSEPDLTRFGDDLVAVLGLSDLARPRRGRTEPVPLAASMAPSGYAPVQIAGAYGLSTGGGAADGTGETVAVLEFGSAFAPGDLAAFWTASGVAAPTVATAWALPPGQEAPPAPPLGADVEATSDVEWVGALAPGARVAVVNAVAGGSATTFAQAIARALQTAVGLSPAPSVVSISYGDGEAFFAPAELRALDLLCARAAALGVTVVVASGDDGAYGVPVDVGPVQMVDAPACLPHVLAVGGTRLELSDGVVARETAWSARGQGTGASGGGVSAVFAAPAWQGETTVAAASGGGDGRGVPDVAACADPATGYAIVLAGNATVVGGTSLAAPVWAAALARVNQARRAAGALPIGLAAPALYAAAARPTQVRDILVGDNAYRTAPGYRCRTGWDAVTGVGAPAGPALWAALAPTAASAPAAALATSAPADEAQPAAVEGADPTAPAGTPAAAPDAAVPSDDERVAGEGSGGVAVAPDRAIGSPADEEPAADPAELPAATATVGWPAAVGAPAVDAGVAAKADPAPGPDERTDGADASAPAEAPATAATPPGRSAAARRTPVRAAARPSSSRRRTRS